MEEGQKTKYHCTNLTNKHNVWFSGGVFLNTSHLLVVQGIIRKYK